jgi:D-glycero-alpha-D-manno-heptose-7-phosphate kinase
LIITRTPLRVSFLGGGSDFEEFFKEEAGYVFGSAINLFVYTAVLRHSELADNKYKLTYRINESVDFVEDLQHPLVREILKRHNDSNSGLHIATLADVPARTGLGSSSAFAVGLIHAISKLNNKESTPEILAALAIEVERKILLEPGGWQDQCHSAYGGLNLFKYSGENFVRKLEITDAEFISLLSTKLILVAAGEARDSSFYAKSTSDKLPSEQGRVIARKMASIAQETANLIASDFSPEAKIIALAEAMNESWTLKQQLSSTCTEEVFNTIKIGRDSGAIAAKLCGAGGSGFVLFLLGDTSQELFSQNFPNRKVQKIHLHLKGSEMGPGDWL